MLRFYLVAAQIFCCLLFTPIFASEDNFVQPDRQVSNDFLDERSFWAGTYDFDYDEPSDNQLQFNTNLKIQSTSVRQRKPKLRDLEAQLDSEHGIQVIPDTVLNPFELARNSRSRVNRLAVQIDPQQLRPLAQKNVFQFTPGGPVEIFDTTIPIFDTNELSSEFERDKKKADSTRLGPEQSSGSRVLGYRANGDAVMMGNKQYGDKQGRGRRPNSGVRPDLIVNQHKYSQPQPDYNQPSPNYDQRQPDYKQPQPNYDNNLPDNNQPKPNYDQQQPNYNQPQPNHDNHLPDNNQPQPNYDQQQPNYNQPQPNYDNHLPDNNQLQPNYDQQQPSYNQPQPNYDNHLPDNNQLHPNNNHHPPDYNQPEDMIDQIYNGGTPYEIEFQPSPGESQNGQSYQSPEVYPDLYFRPPLPIHPVLYPGQFYRPHMMSRNNSNQHSQWSSPAATSSPNQYGQIPEGADYGHPPLPTPQPKPVPRSQPYNYQRPQPVPQPQPEPQPNYQYPQSNPGPQPNNYHYPQPRPKPQPAPQPRNYKYPKRGPQQPPRRPYYHQTGPQPKAPPGFYPDNQSPAVRPKHYNNGNGYPLVMNSGYYGNGQYVRTPSPALRPIDCFLKYPNCVIVNLIPFERRTLSNEKRCLELCLNAEKDIGKVCVAAVHVNIYRTCDLYSEDGTEPPAQVLALYGFNYYRPNGRCNGGIPTPTPYVTPQPGYGGISTTRRPFTRPTNRPPRTTTRRTTTTDTTPSRFDCEDEDTDVLFQRAEGWELVGSDGVTTLDISEADCVEACRENFTPDGDPYDCLSMDYKTDTQTCILSTEAAAPTRSGVLRENPDNVYYEKLCISSDYVDSCRGREIDRQSQMVMVGFGETVETSESITECLELCFSSEELFDFVCMSALFFYEETDLNCLLQTESRRTRPDFFAEENENRVEYLGLDDCLESKSASVRQSTNILSKLPSPVPAPTTEKPILPFTVMPLRKLRIKANKKHNRKSKRIKTNSKPSKKSEKKRIKLVPLRNIRQKDKHSSFKPLKLASENEIKEILGVQDERIITVKKEEEQRLTVILGQWMEWTNCDRTVNGRKKRYRVCNAPRPELCPFETEWCNTEFPRGHKLGMIIPENEFFRDNLPIDIVTLPPWANSINPKIREEVKRKEERKRNHRGYFGRCLPYNGSCKIGIRFLENGRRRYCLKVQAVQCLARKGLKKA